MPRFTFLNEKTLEVILDNMRIANKGNVPRENPEMEIYQLLHSMLIVLRDPKYKGYKCHLTDVDPENPTGSKVDNTPKKNIVLENKSGVIPDICLHCPAMNLNDNCGIDCPFIGQNIRHSMPNNITAKELDILQNIDIDTFNKFWQLFFEGDD